MTQHNKNSSHPFFAYTSYISPKKETFNNDAAADDYNEPHKNDHHRRILECR